MKNKSNNALTLVELIIASVLISLVIAGIGVAMSISLRTHDFMKKEADKADNIRFASEHLAKYIKNSGYGVVTGGTTLALYDSSSNLSGTYTLTNKLLTFTNASGAVQRVADGISLTFTEFSGDPGKATEIKVQFSEPYSEILYVSCRLTFSNTWARVYGGLPVQFIQTSDNGYVISLDTNYYGPTTAPPYSGMHNVHIIKTDENGAIAGTYDSGTKQFINNVPPGKWQKVYGGTGFDSSARIIQTSDGGYFIVCGTTSFDTQIPAAETNYFELYLIKTDANGNTAGTYNSVTKQFDNAPADVAAGRWQKIQGRGFCNTRPFLSQQTSDGGFVIMACSVPKAEYAGLPNKFRYYVIRTDATGNTAGTYNTVTKKFVNPSPNPKHIWQQVFGGNGDGYWNYPAFIIQAPDGGYVIAGATNFYGIGTSAWGSEYNIYVLKTDLDGNTAGTYNTTTKQFDNNAADLPGKWQRVWGGDRSETTLISPGPMMHVPAVSGQGEGYIIPGLKQTYGGSGPSYPQAYLIRTDLAGATAGTYNTFYNKFENNETYRWQHVYRGPYSVWLSSGCHLRQASDGNYVIGFDVDQYYSDFDLAKINSNPSEYPIWNKRYGGANREELKAMESTQDGGYIMVGTTNSFGIGDLSGNGNFYVIKTDPNGNTAGTYDSATQKFVNNEPTRWQTVLGGNSTHETPIFIKELSDGGYIIGGWSKSFRTDNQMDAYLIKTDSEGNCSAASYPTRAQ